MKKRPMVEKIKSTLFLRSAFCILTSALLPTLSGCELPGVLLHVMIGELPTPALYEPKKVPTLVLVENYRSPDEMQLDGDQISHQIGDELKKEAKLEIIDSDKLVPLREEDPTKFRAMTCQAIGKSVGARQIIYVDLLESAVNGDVTQTAVHASARAQVRVMDVETGNTLWPVNASHGKELDANADYDPSDSSHATSMRTEMLSKLSSKIAKMFYTWKPDSTEESDDGG